MGSPKCRHTLLRPRIERNRLLAEDTHDRVGDDRETHLTNRTKNGKLRSINGWLKRSPRLSLAGICAVSTIFICG
jgi:hypothetical protein